MQELAGRSRDLEEQHALAAAEAARLQEQVRTRLGFLNTEHNMF
jgi:hypothetical protein